MDFRIVEGADQISIDEVIRLLKTTYWANKRSREQIEKSMRNSSCYGICVEDEQKLAGFARVISDFATTWYLCDVIIDPEYRHRGLGKALVSHIASLPEYAGLRGFLFTRDAHGLYEKYGFETVDGRVMVKAPAGAGGNHGTQNSSITQRCKNLRHRKNQRRISHPESLQRR